MGLSGGEGNLWVGVLGLAESRCFRRGEPDGGEEGRGWIRDWFGSRLADSRGFRRDEPDGGEEGRGRIGDWFGSRLADSRGFRRGEPDGGEEGNGIGVVVG